MWRHINKTTVKTARIRKWTVFQKLTVEKKTGFVDKERQIKRFFPSIICAVARGPKRLGGTPAQPKRMAQHASLWRLTRFFALHLLWFVIFFSFASDVFVYALAFASTTSFLLGIFRRILQWGKTLRGNWSFQLTSHPSTAWPPSVTLETKSRTWMGANKWASLTRAKHNCHPHK